MRCRENFLLQQDKKSDIKHISLRETLYTSIIFLVWTPSFEFVNIQHFFFQGMGLPHNYKTMQGCSKINCQQLLHCSSNYHLILTSQPSKANTSSIFIVCCKGRIANMPWLETYLHVFIWGNKLLLIKKLKRQNGAPKEGSKVQHHHKVYQG